MKHSLVTNLGFAALIILAVLVHPFMVAAEVVPKVRLSVRRFVRNAVLATLVGIAYGFIYAMKFVRLVLHLSGSTKVWLRKMTKRSVIAQHPTPQKGVV